ncbi:3-hydroxyacyl-ACP dehydratase FabZ family protein [Streptomyces sp. TP-A0874]|uniref:3-hydroxyacyl-ACP dehydratase FabZ family protein n=1 Tax=Streptomyces sp. TP-A0874 TaxID=549819 RepID=UPI000852EFBB|nr:hypothetical protein [Streptomyces sp. TP-A0874]
MTALTTPATEPERATGLRAGPVAGAVEVLEAPGESQTAVRFTVSADELVLPGHYPGFPIFPGVCLVECVHTGALATAPGRPAGIRLAGIESARFTGPVFPGDEFTVTMDWKAVEGGWRCKAKLRSQRGDAAQVRLRYQTFGDGEGVDARSAATAQNHEDG